MRIIKRLKEIFSIGVPVKEAACCHNCEHGEHCVCVVCEDDLDMMVCKVYGKHVKRYGLCLTHFKNKHKKD